MIRLRYLIPFAIAVLFIGGGWTLRNQLAADRQGEWVKVTRGDLATGVDVTGTLASAEAGSFGPPMLNNVWDFKIAMLAPEARMRASHPEPRGGQFCRRSKEQICSTSWLSSCAGSVE